MYDGWTNWATWNAFSLLDNSEGTQRECIGATREKIIYTYGWAFAIDQEICVFEAFDIIDWDQITKVFNKKRD